MKDIGLKRDFAERFMWEIKTLYLACGIVRIWCTGAIYFPLFYQWWILGSPGQFWELASGSTSIKLFWGGARDFFFFFFFWGCKSKKMYLHNLLFVCWNHQIWSNFNTFEIIWGGQTGGKKIFWAWISPHLPNPILWCHWTIGSFRKLWFWCLKLSHQSTLFPHK